MSCCIFQEFVDQVCRTLYTCWTAPSLTFDLLCRSRMMLDEAGPFVYRLFICNNIKLCLMSLLLAWPFLFGSVLMLETAFDNPKQLFQTSFFSIFRIKCMVSADTKFMYVLLLYIETYELLEFFSRVFSSWYDWA